jgi:hypothetical protein
MSSDRKSAFSGDDKLLQERCLAEIANAKLKISMSEKTIKKSLLRRSRSQDPAEIAKLDDEIYEAEEWKRKAVTLMAYSRNALPKLPDIQESPTSEGMFDLCSMSNTILTLNERCEIFHDSYQMIPIRDRVVVCAVPDSAVDDPHDHSIGVSYHRNNSQTLGSEALTVSPNYVNTILQFDAEIDVYPSPELRFLNNLKLFDNVVNQVQDTSIGNSFSTCATETLSQVLDLFFIVCIRDRLCALCLFID